MNSLEFVKDYENIKSNTIVIKRRLVWLGYT